MASIKTRLPRSLGFFLGLLGAFALALVLTMFLMDPPPTDFAQLSLIYAGTVVVSGLLGVVADRLGWWRRFRSLSRSLSAGYVLAAALTLVSVWVAARLMFLSEHDLRLAGVLLLFAAAISVAIGAFLSSSLADAVRKMAGAAEQLSRGEFSTRVSTAGHDEVARLADAFNRMAERLQAANEESHRLETARRDLVAWVSHDLRTPLAALQAMIDALAEGVVDDPDTIQRYLLQSQSEIGRMSELIDDLFELARLDAGRIELVYEHCSLQDLVSDALGGAAAQAEVKEVELVGAIRQEADMVRLAPRAIERVLRNLLDNALRHVPAGGTIEVCAERAGEAVVISVRNSGEGIDPHVMPRLFERFYRGERSRSRGGFDHGGSGLGLAIARGLVTAHGGSIWAENPAEGGAAFFFSIPETPSL